MMLCGLMAAAPASKAVSEGAPVGSEQTDRINVKGKVVDENGEPMIGAGVIVAGTTTGTMTDMDGNFTLSVPADATLQISSVGFKDVTVAVGGRTDLGTISIHTDNELLDQVVVIGYGTQKKADLTGSVAVVDAEQMKKVSHSNISTMLEGKVAGVQITSDGQPGADPSVRIRGIGSFGSTALLYVIDRRPHGNIYQGLLPK